MALVVAVAAAVVVIFMAASVLPGTLFMLGAMCSPGLHWFDTTVLARLREYILMATTESEGEAMDTSSTIIKEHKGVCFVSVSKN